jgi:hypothetical protein
MGKKSILRQRNFLTAVFDLEVARITIPTTAVTPWASGWPGPMVSLSTPGSAVRGIRKTSVSACAPGKEGQALGIFPALPWQFLAFH